MAAVLSGERNGGTGSLHSRCAANLVGALAAFDSGATADCAALVWKDDVAVVAGVDVDPVGV